MVSRFAPRQPPTLRSPDWFTDFLADRAVRKPSPHTTKAYRQDFEAIAVLMAGSAVAVSDLPISELSKDRMRSAFATYADTHSAASIRRCWSTWNTLCTFLFTAEVLEANPMPLIGRPKVPKTLPKSYPAHAVTDLVAAIDGDYGSTRTSDWAERDRAIVFTSLLAGLRADELLNANVGDIRRTDDGGVLHVRGKGNKDRRIPIGADLVQVIDDYLRTRASRYPQSRRRASRGDGSGSFSPIAALFVGADGDRITRGTLQYRILRAFKKAGINGGVDLVCRINMERVDAGKPVTAFRYDEFPGVMDSFRFKRYSAGARESPGDIPASHSCAAAQPIPGALQLRDYHCAAVAAPNPAFARAV